ncbi:Retrovirus-related Pol polyprotein from transposon 17.6-like Protein [Tribolium castaneum]|uniref:Retrovirus-related Pol polyprotein from transposon 17.6-like Protein n=1 Tax=Tribolium castaneum TaxID=7070 RepID=D7EKX9_TRICA|nr:Retrovirus-related Pol polyprotein from transposon 17.6-like Protein [Tribolium castaneum]
MGFDHFWGCAIGFLGLCNWVREYIPNFAIRAAFLTDLLAYSKRWHWEEIDENAFSDLKKLLSKPEPLHRPDPKLPFILQTDASGIGLVAVLFKKKITDKLFTLRTDNRALAWLQTMSDQRSKLTRWALQLQSLNFKIEHCPSKNNKLPDFLSRRPDENRKLDHHDYEDNERLLPPEHSNYIDNDYVPALAVACPANIETLAEDARQGQQSDPFSQQTIRRLQHFAENSSQKELHNYFTDDQHLYFSRKLYVLPEIRSRVLFELHDSSLSAHSGIDETE